MDRLLEPELMEDKEQAEAYANADFENSHGRVIELFDIRFQQAAISGNILDLGCGPGDITFRLACRFPQASVAAIDGSAAMINLANRRKVHEGRGKIEFIQGFIPGVRIASIKYDLIISTSLLHHLPDPLVLWKFIDEYSSPGTKIFVYDLLRPDSPEEAMRLVNLYSGDEPPVLKNDFYRSLLAAFEPEEIRQQLITANLSELEIDVVSDRHILVFGMKT